VVKGRDWCRGRFHFRAAIFRKAGALHEGRKVKILILSLQGAQRQGWGTLGLFLDSFGDGDYPTFGVFEGEFPHAIKLLF
jgi:hypothetical protein